MSHTRYDIDVPAPQVSKAQANTTDKRDAMRLGRDVNQPATGRAHDFNLVAESAELEEFPPVESFSVEGAGIQYASATSLADMSPSVCLGRTTCHSKLFRVVIFVIEFIFVHTRWTVLGVLSLPCGWGKTPGFPS